MKNWLTAIVVAAIVANIFLYWNTVAVYGWVVALAGWVPHLFEKKGSNNGN
jgi:hypothetical protein